jgi:transposase
MLKGDLRTTIETLLKRGASLRQIARSTGVSRNTISSHLRRAGGRGCDTTRDIEELATACPPAPAACPPDPAFAKKPTDSVCEPHREWIEAQLRLRRNAQSIYQDLVESRGFTHRYSAVKRFVRKLKRRDPEQFDVLEFIPAEEAQVDYGQGALTLHPSGKYRKPYLFVMTLAYSGKAFRKVVWRTDQQVWAELHQQAFRAFGGCPRHVVLNNLKEGVIKPDLYEPILNPVYSAMLAHHHVIADPCRVGDPDRKGSVENAIKHTQNTALKGRRFESIEAQNAWLAHWEERWAATRIHGRKKRQVMAMFQEEKTHLLALPLESFRPFKYALRTVDNAGLIQVESSYYSALPAALHSEVAVRIYANDIEILGREGQVLRRHEKSAHKGAFVLPEEDRIFNPSRESAQLLGRIQRIGPKAAQLATEIFDRLGRPGHRAIYALANLVNKYSREQIEAACAHTLLSSRPCYQSVKRYLLHHAEKAPPTVMNLRQSGPEIRSIAEYQAFWDRITDKNS